MFLTPEGDHYRTRLTHTLEVSQNARTIAKALKLNEELVEAIALGHDLGHTPFGHAGERALDRVCPTGFEHAKQSVRTVAGLAFRKKCSVNAWIGVCLSVAGLVCLSLLTDSATGSNEMLGNALVLLAAVAFTAHILVIDRFAPNLNGVALSCVQFFTSGVLTLVLMLLFEKPVISVILSEPVAVLYAGIMSCGVAYTFQILGQDGANPTLASLILCLESVFSVIGGILFLHDSMDAIEWIGCALMFGGIVISQLPDRKKAEGAGNASESQKAD